MNEVGKMFRSGLETMVAAMGEDVEVDGVKNRALLDRDKEDAKKVTFKFLDKAAAKGASIVVLGTGEKFIAGDPQDEVKQGVFIKRTISAVAG